MARRTPLQQQSITDSELPTRVSALEKICANFEKKNKLQDKTTQALSSRVYTLENHDMYSNIDKYVNEVVKEAIHNALQAPIHKRFRDLSKFEMKEILRDRMFENGSYRSHPKALEASMDRENREEFNEEIAKSRKRHLQKSSAWKTSNTREALSGSSKKKSASPSEQPIDDVPIPDGCCIVFFFLRLREITVLPHLPKIKTRPDWLKPLPEEEAPETLEPDWVIPPNDLPETENNWSDALAKTYKDPEENKLLWKTRDMGSFINWYCKQIGKLKLAKADLEGPTYKSDCLLIMRESGRTQIRKPLPLGGPLKSGDKERRNALSISKLKAAYYPDFELEELVPSLWIESERNYDISAAYGISQWWFKSKEFYITRHSAPSDTMLVRSHMEILKCWSGKLNHLSRADKVHLFNAVNLWIRNIVIRQRVEYLKLSIESYQTKLNLTQPRWEATDFLFKEDYTIVHKPRAIIYKDRNYQKKMMRETEVHKFSDDTLTGIL
ncbi:hypothetical protein Tco_0386748 [Tanacetum coccineum]